MSWKTVPLREVLSDIQTGTTPSTSRPEFFHGSIPWFTPSDIGGTRGLLKSSRSLSEQGLRVGKAKLFPKGSLLVTCIGNIGRVGILERAGSSNQQITSLTFNGDVSVRYAYYWFVAYQNRLERQANQAVVPILNNERLGEIRFAYPSTIVEQEGIAGQLEKADRLRRMRRYALELSDTLLPAAFLQLFGDLEREPNRWTRVGFDDACRISEDMVDPTNSAYADLPQISSEDIESVSGELGHLRTAKQKGVISTNFLVKPEEILFSKIRPKLRKVAYPKRTSLCSADIYPMRLIHSGLHPSFLVSYLRSTYFSRIVERLAESRSNIPKVNRDELSEQTIPLPPLSLQNEFAVMVGRLEMLRAVQRESLRQAEYLFQTLLHRAFANNV